MVGNAPQPLGLFANGNRAANIACALFGAVPRVVEPEQEKAAAPDEPRVLTRPCHPLEGCLSNSTALAIVFKLVESAQTSWRRLDGHGNLPKIIQGVKFADGLRVIAKPIDRQPKIAAA